MNHALNNPEGIDLVIKDIQTDIYNRLSSLWTGEINAFGRVYRNKDGDFFYPEWHNASTGEYESVYFDDAYAGNLFFLVGSDHSSSDELLFSVDAKCAFMLNLDSILPGKTERADALVQKQAVEALRELGDGKIEITGIETGIENIFRGMDTSGIGFEDTHPKHSFAVRLKLFYYLNC